MPVTHRPLARRLLLVGLALCVASQADAQGRIRGTVVDRDGDPIAGAIVDAEELATNRTSTATSNESGRFSFLGLNRGEWMFVVRADGFEPAQGMAVVLASGPGTSVQFTMDRDLFNPAPPAGGVLGGLRATQLLDDLAAADGLFAAGDYDAAIEAYEALLTSAPALTSVNLQIGHAYQALEQPDQAIASYRAALAADPTNREAAAALSSAGVVAPGR
ncbi:MAG: carboxypeptidase regulatory-like domain-containing protein [Ilumatobacter sp.]|jgi:tetratricopeptide (TPR) repeat protein|nr:carboxypeptidase regulatory-like domain-containing protein [Ilumatobacter sp.]